MALSEKAIKEYRELAKKNSGMELSWEEASEGAYNLAGLAKLMIDFYFEDERRKKKLEEFPKGFHLEGGYTCAICGNGASGDQSWYDKWGIKCMDCQRAIDRKEIPASLAKNQDIWYSKYDLESRFNLNTPMLKKWIEKGILKARTLTHDGKRPRMQVFLVKDNKDTLPPKKLTDSRGVKETKDGKDWYHSEPWYRFDDMRARLKGYKIMNYLKITSEEKRDDATKETKNETMKLKDLFKIGGIMQSIDGRTAYLDHNNCVIHSRTKSEDAVILHLKRMSDGEEGNVYLRVQDKFKSAKDQLLNWAFASSSIMGLTLNQLENLDTDLTVENSNGKLSLHQK